MKHAKNKMLAPKYVTAVLFALLCPSGSAFVLHYGTSPAVAHATTSAACSVPATALAPSPVPRVSSLVLSESKPLPPIALVTVGGGAAGIFFAAFCTSTGSPPTGLAVAGATVLFMFLGATVQDSSD